MIEPFQLLERQMLIAPLGVRFWDVATGAYVSSGLTVRVYRDDDHLHSNQASPNASGTYVLHHASGMRLFELGVGNPQFTDSLPASQPFMVEVTDVERRFIPLKFEAGLPCKGLFDWQKTITEGLPLDPPVNNPSVPLYSSTMRTAPPGMALLRAELYESPAEEINDVRKTKPAAWAMIEARSGGRLLARGIADEKGRIVLIFAYPAPHDSSSSFSTSPAGPFTAGLPFRQQEWAIQLEAFYEPSALSPPPASLSPLQPFGSSSGDEPSIPILSDILKQSPVNLFLDEAQTEPLTEVTLSYGPKVFVPSLSSPVGSPPNPRTLSVLFVSPAD
ncbi:MAG: hypothetical protein QOH70_3849 [Blastocatellia bacterium]|jgi:hypothetical protein|nr:hypothetical protein [Blastocatellia bacterium]